MMATGFRGGTRSGKGAETTPTLSGLLAAGALSEFAAFLAPLAGRGQANEGYRILVCTSPNASALWIREEPWTS